MSMFYKLKPFLRAFKKGRLSEGGSIQVLFSVKIIYPKSFHSVYAKTYTNECLSSEL